MRSWRRSVADAPLSGIAVVVTRPEAQARTLALELEGLGARVARVPLVEIAEVEDEAALDAAGRALASYDWVVFTSANGVRAFGERLTLSVQGPRVAVVGPATANALRESGTEPTFVGAGAAESIAAGLDSPEGARVLLLQADIAGSGLADALRERGALVDAVTAYRTVGRVPTEGERQALDEADAIVLASGSAARSLAALEPAGAGALIACIGPKTASAAREVGLRVDLVADETTADGMIRALVEHYGEST
jgi:uroporphyrinogen-III synthase